MVWLMQAHSASALPLLPWLFPGAPATAQAAAVLISSTGRFRHNGGHGLFEGIGMGSTEAAAVGNCCQPRFGGRPREVGIARMANGLFVAVCRW